MRFCDDNSSVPPSDERDLREIEEAGVHLETQKNFRGSQESQDEQGLA